MRSLPAALGAALLLPAALGAATLPAASRLDALVRARPENAAAVVRSLLAGDAAPAETLGYAYVLAAGEGEGTVLPVDETLIRMSPWQSPPSWYAAFRYGDRRYGSPLPEAPRFDLEMAAPPGEDIAVGTYENAQAFAFQDEGRPGLTVKGICATEGGRFEIVEMHRNRVSLIDRFGATFETDACRGFVVYRRGTNDWTGLVTDDTPVFPRPDVPIPALADVVAELAADDPQLVGWEIPAAGSEDVAVLYARGYEWIGRGGKHLVVGRGAEVEPNYGWSPKLRVADFEIRLPRDDGYVDMWEGIFASGIQEELGIGFYPHAGGIPYQAAGYPGIRIAGKTRGCTGAAGWYRVLELKRDAAGEFTTFAADFEQHCEGWGPALRGFFLYRRSTGGGSS